MKIKFFDFLMIFIITSFSFLLISPPIISFLFLDQLNPITNSRQQQIIQSFYSHMDKRGIDKPHIEFYQYPGNFLTNFLNIYDSFCLLDIIEGGIINRRVVILDSSARERTIYHEMAHCALHRGHEFSLDEKGYPTSWMHQMGNKKTEAYLIKNKKVFIEELFSKRNDVFFPERTESWIFPSKTLLKNYQMWVLGSNSFLDFLLVLLASLFWPIFFITIFCFIINLALNFLKSKNYHG